MGKLEADGTESTGTDSEASGLFRWVRRKISWGCLLPVLLAVYLLVFAIWSLISRSGNESNPVASPSELWIPIEASFRLHKSIVAINASLQRLQVALQNEMGIPDTQIDIKAVVPLLPTNWTEVRFTVSPDPLNDSIAPAEMSLLKDTFIELFMRRSANLSLTEDIFGKVSHFEVLHFPGGITVVPQQPGFPLSKVLVLFNFTLRNSLSHVASNFGKFREQLADGILLKPNENLLVELTNADGSTLHSPLIVQTSILPVVGALLPTMRLRQLAQEILASPERNLGLNHTLFGRVKGVELSSYLSDTLVHPQAPNPSPAPGPTNNNRRSCDKTNRHCHSGHHHHRQHNALVDGLAPSPFTSCSHCYPHHYPSPLHSEQSSGTRPPPQETDYHRTMAQSPYPDGKAPAESPLKEAFAPMFTSSGSPPAIIIVGWGTFIMLPLLLCGMW